MAGVKDMSDAELRQAHLRALPDDELSTLYKRATGPEMRAVPEDQVIPEMKFDEVDLRPPGMAGHMITGPSREFMETARTAFPIFAELGTAIASGGTSIPVQALRAGGATVIADLLAQKTGPDDVSIEQAAKKGAFAWGGTHAFGHLFKFLFPASATTDELARARDYAAANDLPQPLQLAGKTGATLGRGTVVGDLLYERTLRKFKTLLDTHVTSLRGKVTDSKETITGNARAKLKELFDRRQGFVAMKELVGAKTPVDLTPLFNQLDDLILEVRGAGGGKILEVLENLKAAQMGGLPPTRTFDTVDGMFKKVLDSTDPATHAIGNRIRNLIDTSIDGSVPMTPEIKARMANDFPGATSLAEVLKKSYQSFATISNVLKNNPELKRLISGTTTLNSKQAGAFLKYWSESPVAREAIKKIDPKVWQDLNEGWMAQNVDRFVYGAKGFDGARPVKLDGDGLLSFLGQQKKVVEEMFGEQGYEGLRNLGFYIKYSQAYKGAPKDMGFIEGGTRLAGEVYTLGPFGATLGEGIGGTLVHQLMSPGSVLNRVLGVSRHPATRSAARAFVDRPAIAAAGPLGFAPSDLFRQDAVTENVLGEQPVTPLTDAPQALRSTKPPLNNWFPGLLKQPTR